MMTRCRCRLRGSITRCPTGLKGPVVVRMLLALIATLGLLIFGPAADANWLTRLAHEAGDVGARSAKVGLRALDDAATHLKALPPTEKDVALAAHAMPEGHWKFVNSEGEVFTAGTREELKRAVLALAPEASAEAQAHLTLFLTEDTVFDQRALLKDLPAEAELRLAVGRDSYRLSRRAGGGSEKLFAEVRPNIVVEVADRALFDEALWQLGRSLNKADVRILALEPGGPEGLVSVPRMDPTTSGALVDVIDPARLPHAMRGVRGQTLLVTGRIEGNLLHVRPANGGERTLVLSDLTRAAEAADVNLVILNSARPVQPGGRNWLWQKVEVAGLDEALQRATFADFLNALGANRGQLVVMASKRGDGRMVLRAAPSGTAGAPMTDTLAGWFSDLVPDITGSVVAHAIEAHVRDKERQSELDTRVLPGIPSGYQIAYLIGVVLGVMGLGVARGWWDRLWPAEQRADYDGAVGYVAARMTRLFTFALLFLPIAGAPAFLAATALQIWGLVKVPFRFLYKLASRARAAS